MRIFYLFTSPVLEGNSVQTKVINQINNLNKAGADCKGAFFSTQVSAETNYDEFVRFLPLQKCTWKYFKKIGQRRILDETIKEFIRNNYEHTDVFYLRYPGASKKLYKIANDFGEKIVSEHQSKEVEEIKSFKKENPFGLRPSKFLGWLMYQFYPIYQETLWGKRYARKVKAIVTVTSEIAEFQRKKGCKNVIVTTNGIDVHQYKIRSFKNNNNSPLTLLFLKGTSSKAEWNGIERLISSIDSYKGNSQIKLYICGHFLEGEIPERTYIKHLGYLKKDELDLLVEEVTLGVSTLALYKKSLNEASVLKTREYVARGLPFIYAYTDPDLNDESKAFTIEFPNDETIIDIETVIEFVKKIQSDPEIPIKMRKYAEVHLDFEIKMKQFYNNLKKLMNA